MIGLELYYPARARTVAHALRHMITRIHTHDDTTVDSEQVVTACIQLVGKVVRHHDFQQLPGLGINVGMRGVSWRDGF